MKIYPGDFFEVRRANVLVALKSPARATLFWFLFGLCPYRIIAGIHGDIKWQLPEPLENWKGGCEVFRDGEIK